MVKTDKDYQRQLRNISLFRSRKPFPHNGAKYSLICTRNPGEKLNVDNSERIITQRPLPVGGIARVNGDLVVRVDSGRIGRLPQHKQSCFVPEPHNKPSRGIGFGGKIRGDVFGALFPVNRGELDFVRGSRSQISKIVIWLQNFNLRFSNQKCY